MMKTSDKDQHCNKIVMSFFFAFIAAIFYGDVWVGITVPVAILFLIVLFILTLDTQPFLRPLPKGLALLIGTLCIVGIQYASGRPLQGKTDFVAYLPLIYAIATLFTLSKLPANSTILWRSLICGGLITGAVMVAVMTFAPDDFYLVRSQFQPSAKESLRQAYTRLEIERSGALPNHFHGGQRKNMASSPIPDEQFSPPVDASTLHFYGAKSSVRNALGFSNYIAVFFIILLNVALYLRKKVLILAFILLTVLTLSRFGFLFLLTSLFIYYFSKTSNITNIRRVLIFILIFTLCGIGFAIYAEPIISKFPQLASMTARIHYWISGERIFVENPIFGSPRSYFVDQFGLTVFWNPHNAILWVGSLFGIAGIILYAAYLWCALESIRSMANASDLWRGVYVGAFIAVIWSLIEPIVLTPAFEIFLAAMYGISFASTRPAQTEARVSLAPCA